MSHPAAKVCADEQGEDLLRTAAGHRVRRLRYVCAPTAVLVGARCSGMEGMAFKPIGRFLD